MNQRATLLALLLAVPLLGHAAATPGAWPRTLTSGSTKYVVYEPEPAALDGNTLLSRSAVSVQRAGENAPTFGAIETTSKLALEDHGRQARVASVSVDRVRFPGVREDSPEARELEALLEREWPRWNLVLSIDELSQSLAGAASARALSNSPPRFLYIDEPALLVTIDGEPRLQAIGDSGLERVVNTPFPLIHDRAARRYYFYGSSVWFTTTDLLRGTWTVTDRVPEPVAALFAGNESAVEGSADDLRRARLVVVTEPTELISTDGAAQLQPLVDGELLAVVNTDSDVFLHVPTQAWYTVASGRWYKANALSGSWSYVDPSTLPASFARIPAGSTRGSVLAHVPGTQAARDAVLDAAIPQTTAVDRQSANFKAEYDGAARFEQVNGTDLHYAVNTASQVILADDRYYAVDQGVWYISDSPYGPWKVSETRPNGLDSVPPSSPIYNTRYVYIYDVQPDVIYMGYTPGYVWTFPYAGAVVYGTGHRYRPWVSANDYYPRPWTYGFNMNYAGWGGWSYGMSWNTGWLGASSGWGGYWNRWPNYYSGYRRGYWDGVHSGGWFGPGGYHRPRPPGHRPPEHRPPGGLPPGSRPPLNPRSQQVVVRQPVPGRSPSRPDERPQNLYEQPRGGSIGAPRPAPVNPRAQQVSSSAIERYETRQFDHGNAGRPAKPMTAPVVETSRPTLQPRPQSQVQPQPRAQRPVQPAPQVPTLPVQAQPEAAQPRQSSEMSSSPRSQQQQRADTGKSGRGDRRID